MTKTADRTILRYESTGLPIDHNKCAFRSGTAAPLVIANAQTDERLGLINLQFRTDDAAGIAYSAFPDWRGQGIAGRSVQLVARWATEELTEQA